MGEVVCTKVLGDMGSGAVEMVGWGWGVQGREVTVTNLFPTPLFLKTLTITLTNITNPPLAISTGNFLIKIGTDISHDS